VVGNDVTKTIKAQLKKLVLKHSPKSSLTFYAPNRDFNKSWLGSRDVSICYRCMLPKLLPASIKKVIYLDADMVFIRDLIAASEIDLKNNLIAGVTDAWRRGQREENYLNSGFLIMNLEKIRREKIYPRFIKVLREEKYEFPDQCMLNEVCKGRKLLLPWSYNFMPGEYYKKRSASEMEELKKNLTVIHYAGLKPWEKDKAWPLTWVWHKYAKDLENSFK
jgi:lipopolysaccharide biosynthesis glycosyltransferase